MKEVRRLGAPAAALVAAVCCLLATVALAGVSGPWFVEADDSGVDFTYWNGMTGRYHYAEVIGGGGALFDYDNDGDLDLYLVQGHLLSTKGEDDPRALVPWRGNGPPVDRLFRNEIGLDGSARGLRFTDVTEASGIVARGYGVGAAVGDYDNDGDIDLYVLNLGANELWRNEGGGTFVEVASEAGVADPRWSASSTFIDYDNDGWLDLYVANYLQYSLLAHRCLSERGDPDYCSPLAYPPISDRLYHNRGDGTFEDVSEAAGIAGIKANGLGVVGADFNDDSRLDFYVANDLMPNNLWLNQGDGTFVDDGLLSGAALNREGKAEASMGLALGDYDRDGDLDLFMTHFRRESNTLYRHRGGGLYDDVSHEASLVASSWPHTSFGTGFLDYDNDGWLDLVIANGAVTYRAGQEREGPFDLDETNQLLHNLRGLRFEDVSDHAGPAFERSQVSRGALLGDLDNDGDTDVVFTNNSAPAQILLNRVGSETAWIGVRAVLGSPARDAHGAILGLELEGEPPLVRRAAPDGGYASSNDPRVLFGIGNSRPLSLTVHWPDGTTELFPSPPLKSYTLVTRGTGRPVAE